MRDLKRGYRRRARSKRQRTERIPGRSRALQAHSLSARFWSAVSPLPLFWLRYSQPGNVRPAALPVMVLFIVGGLACLHGERRNRHRPRPGTRQTRRGTIQHASANMTADSLSSPNRVNYEEMHDFIVFYRGTGRKQANPPRQARSGRDHPPTILQHKAMFNPTSCRFCWAPPSSGEQ